MFTKKGKQPHNINSSNMVLSKLHNKKYTSKEQIIYTSIPIINVSKNSCMPHMSTQSYTMNFNKMAPIASKIGTNQQIDTKIYVKTPCEKKLRTTRANNPL